MRRFRFNLEALLRIYARNEEKYKKELGDANRALIEAENELVSLGNEYDLSQENEARLREKGETKMPFSNIPLTLKTIILLRFSRNKN